MEPIVTSSSPYVIYQSVDLDVDMQEQTIEGTTILWLLYKDAPPIGSMISLHNRTTVHSVLVNNIPCEFDFRDPLKSLYYESARRQNYLGKEADINFRAGLELTRDGELRFRVPDLTPPLQPSSRSQLDPTCSFESLLTLPRGSSSELTDRFARLQQALDIAKSEILSNEDAKREKRNETTSVENEMNVDENGTLASNGVEEEKSEQVEDGIRSRLLQVKIKYSVPKSTENSSMGVIFRQSVASRISSTCDRSFPWQSFDSRHDTRVQEDTTNKGESAACAYTTGAGGEGGLRDLDGVRCWMPCIDSPEQRPIFDVTIKTQASFQVLCSGKKVSSLVIPDASSHSLMEVTSLRRVTSYLGASAHAYVSSSASNRCASRFVTPVRIAAFALGFFVGNVEVYKVPLYKVHGRAWVALGLADMVLSRNVSQRDEDEDEILKVGAEINRSRNGSIDIIDGDTQRERKRARIHGTSIGGSLSTNSENVDSPLSPSRNRARSRSFGAATGLRDQSNSHEEMEKQARIRSMHVPTLYEAAVRHTSLGLDMSLRLLHKFVGHSYDHDTYTQVYIDGLGDTFIAFDGFSLVDARLLHTEEQVYMETSAHLLHIRAYLYSWFLTSMPLDSFDSAVVIHGAVGFLQNVFVDQVYGENDSMYRLQKFMDTCIELEKQGYGFSLTSGHPESFERLSLFDRVYMSAKSTFLYHLLETHIGGRDAMRLAFKALVKSPSLYVEPPSGTDGHQQGGPLLRADSIENRELGSSMSAVGNSLGSTPYMPISRQNSENTVDPTPFPLFCIEPAHGSVSTASHPALRRQYSEMKDTSVVAWMADPIMLTFGCISIESFFIELRNCASAIIDLPDDFVASFIHNSGAHILHISCAVEAKVEGKSRNINVAVGSISCANGQVGRGLINPMDVKLSIVEVLNEMSSECLVSTNDRAENGEILAFPIQNKPNRQRLRKRKGMAKPSPAQEMELVERLNRERLRHRKLREHLMDSLELAREMEHPVKLLCPDPQSAGLFEAHLQLPDPVLIELIFSEMDSLDPLRHIMALRSIGRINTSGNVSNSIELTSPQMLYDTQLAWTENKGPPRSARLQLRALSDCLNGTCASANRDPKCITGAHHCNIRSEAAFALMEWQNFRAPRSTIEEPLAMARDDSQGQIAPWAALSILLAALRDHFMEDGYATPIDLSSETISRLRYSILLAISSVRSSNGYTPRAAIDAVLHFALTCDEVPPDSSPKSGPFNDIRTKAMDNSHYKCVLLLALSNIRPEPNGEEHFTVLSTIKAFALQCLQSDWTAARTSSRIAARLDEPSRTPVLALGGAITAMSLHCLSELDLYFLELEGLRSTSDFASKTKQSKYGVLGNSFGNGEYSGINYASYFLPVGTVIGSLRVTESVSERFFATCPAIVRAAGLEASTRLLLAQHAKAWDRASSIADELQRQRSLNQVKDAGHVSTALATVFTVLANDQSRWTRRQAALTLQNAILDRSGRVGLLALGMGEIGACVSWSDPDALSVRPTKVRSFSAS